MKLSSSAEFLTEAGTDAIHHFPFMCQPDYLTLNPDIRFLMDAGMAVPVRIRTHRFYRTLQFLFPPMCFDGTQPGHTKEKVFCDAAVSYITREHLAHRIVQPPTYALFSEFASGSVHIPFGTYRVALTGRSDGELLAGMQPRYRSAIRQAERAGAEIRSGIHELDAFHALHLQTMKRGEGYPAVKSQLHKELTHCADHTILATVHLNGTLQGGLLAAYTRSGAFYLHGASKEGTEAAGAIKFLHYKMMIHMRDRHVKFYDFVGARTSGAVPPRLESIQDFKRRFGGPLVPGYLWKIDISPGVSAAADILLRMKCALTGNRYPEDIIDQVRRTSKT
jgi:hypothetical protein